MKKIFVQFLFNFVFIISGCLTVAATILSFTAENNSATVEIYKDGMLEKKQSLQVSAGYQGVLPGLAIKLKGNPQEEEIVKWKYETKKIAEKTYEIQFTPKVKSPWHIYSMYAVDDMGLPTTIYFNKNPLIVLDGKTKEIGMQEKFVQAVKLKTNVKTNLAGEIEFMACNEKQCMPPQTVSFNITLE